MFKTLKTILVIAITSIFTFSFSVFAGENEAKKWIDDEFQP